MNHKVASMMLMQMGHKVDVAANCGEGPGNPSVQPVRRYPHGHTEASRSKALELEA
jgi:hypothetical protein